MSTHSPTYNCKSPERGDGVQVRSSVSFCNMDWEEDHAYARKEWLRCNGPNYGEYFVSDLCKIVPFMLILFNAVKFVEPTTKFVANTLNMMNIYLWMPSSLCGRDPISFQAI